MLRLYTGTTAAAGIGQALGSIPALAAAGDAARWVKLASMIAAAGIAVWIAIMVAKAR